MAIYFVLSGSTAVPVDEPGFGEKWLVPVGASGDWSAHEGEIAVGNGAEGYTYLELASGDIVSIIDSAEVYKFDGADLVDLGSAGLTNPLTTDLDADGNAIENLPAPSNANDAARKAYVDSGDSSVASTASSALSSHASDPDAHLTIAAKGDLPMGTGAGTMAVRSIGTNGEVLCSESDESTGGIWLPPRGVSLLSFKPASGEYLELGCNGIAYGTQAMTADRIEGGAFFLPWDLTIDQVGFRVTVGSASSNVKVVFYGPHSTTRRPNAVLYESGNISSATNGVKTASPSLTFKAHRWYYWFLRSDGTPTLSTFGAGACPDQSYDGTNTARRPMLRRTLTFATAATDPWAYVNTDPVAANPFMVFVRAA